MTKNRNFLLKYYIIQVTIFLAIDQISSAEFSDDQKIAMFENCGIFDNPSIYGGEVCGTDGSTYSNSFYLDCINHQKGTDVGTWHRGACLPGEEFCEPNIVYTPVCGTDNRTWTNLESLLCYKRTNPSNVQMKSQGECQIPDYCLRGGYDVYGINPVCGNNGYTYENVAQIKCLQMDNPQLKILHDGGCLVGMLYQLYGAGERICQMAKHRYEWNPVCGADSVTYTNPFKFLCYKPDLKVLSNSECGAPSHQACIIAHANRTLVNGEYVNDDFSPDDEVCGNDGRTYPSENHVQCHTINNKYLYTKHRGPCSGPDDNPCAAIPEEKKRFPICASNGVTYVSPEALWCAKRRNKDRTLAFIHDGPC